jgi:phospholipid N-methyltransferase
MAIASRARFFWEFVRKPGVVGAVAPSSGGLARRMVEWIDWPRARTVLEYGPGTGAFTREILSRLDAGARMVAIEINPHFAAALAEQFPAVRVHEENVKNVEKVCRDEGIAVVDAILCGLPWASFAPADQDECLEAMLRVLRPGGQFATFAYLQGLLLPAGRRFRRKLRQYFSRVQTSSIVWRNLPPAFVYRCTR